MLIKRLQGPSEKRGGYYYEFDLHSQPLGEGGMGVVYKGFKVYESTGLRNVVAIKAMFDGLPAEVYERAEREASIRLRNDNLVEMLGFISCVEEDPYGLKRNRYYVISEYLNGVVLSDLLTGQFKDKDGIEIPFAKQLYTDYISDKENTAIEIIRSILSGITALHDKGYIHRDIDPTNIMVTDDGNIKLIDFGIAKYVRSLGSVDKSLTSSGKFIGKAEFASPELVLGDVKSQGYSTDIYAIGILFYQLLVGQLPFIGSKYEVLQMQLNKKVPVNKIKNAALAKVVKKATEKDQSSRYSTVSILRVAIDEAVSNRGNVFKKYWKHAAAVFLSSAACALLIFVIKDLQPNEDVVEMENTQISGANGTVAKSKKKDYTTEDYNQALENLNSTDKNKVATGFEQMRSLASRNCIMAKEQIGLTYCSYDNVQSDIVKQRRKLLNLENNISVDSSLKYLEELRGEESLSVEALYVLGYSYWKKHDWNNGEQTLRKALEALSDSGKQDSELEKNIKKYLELCLKELS